MAAASFCRRDTPMLEPVVWFVAGLVMIVLEYFLTVKVRSPLWGAILPLGTLIAAIGVFTVGETADESANPDALRHPGGAAVRRVEQRPPGMERAASKMRVNSGTRAKNNRATRQHPRPDVVVQHILAGVFFAVTAAAADSRTAGGACPQTPRQWRRGRCWR